MDIQKVVELLKKIVKPEQILTDREDLYVYSFEKIFEEQNPVPDIVVTTSSSEETQKVFELAGKGRFSAVKRGEISNQSVERPLLLLDDVPNPELNVGSSKEGETLRILKEIRESGYGNPRNLAFAMKALFSRKSHAKCEECKTCSGYCAVASSFDGVETWSSKGRTIVVRGLQDRELSVSRKVADILYTCTECGLCYAQCFDGLQINEAIMATRHKIAEKGLIPEVFHRVAENILQTGDPGAIPIMRRLSWMKDLTFQPLPEEAEVLYWVGCTVANRTPKTAMAFLKILDSAKVRFTMLKEREGCCGYVLLSTGLWDEAKKIADEVFSKVERTGAAVLVTPCAGCYYTFTKLYPEVLGVSLPCEILHSSHYIERLIDNDKLELKQMDFKVSYHDPCSLGRHSRIFDAPRNILRAIPGMTLTEMSLNRQSSRCCGGGGGLWSLNYQVSMDSAYLRLKDLEPSKSDVLTTACPLCQMNFRYTSARRGLSVRVCDVTEMVELAIR